MSSVSQMPVIAVVAGFDDELPVGMMIHGRSWDEATLLRLADAYESATGWRQEPKSMRDPILVNRPSITEFNRLKREVAWEAFERVLRFGGKFELTADKMRTHTATVLGREEFADFSFLLGD